MRDPASNEPAGERRGPELVPSWNGELGELRFAGQIIKRRKRPAPLQESILENFEQEGWPLRIDDPLPGGFDGDPGERRHDAIRGLNESLRPPLIEFLRDGTGQGIAWRPKSAGSSPPPTKKKKRRRK